MIHRRLFQRDLRQIQQQGNKFMGLGIDIAAAHTCGVCGINDGVKIIIWVV